MATGKFNLTNYGNTSRYTTYYTEYIATPDNLGNFSMITVYVKCDKSSASNEKTAFTANTTVSITDSTPDTQQELGYWFDIYPGQTGELLFAKAGFKVPHNSDGTKTVTISVNMDGNTIAQASGSITIDLDRIPRATAAPDLSGWIGTSYNYAMSPAANFRHSVYVNFGTIKQWLQPDGTLGDSEYKFATYNTAPLFTIPKSFYKEFTSREGVGTISVNTYSEDGNTYIGSASGKLTAICQAALCAPQVDIEQSTIVDINPITVALTGDENNIVRFASNAEVTPVIRASDPDDVNTTLISKSVNNIAFTDDSIVISNATDKTFVVNAVNSRSMPALPTNISAKGALIPYVRLTFHIDKLYRPEPTTGEIQLQYSGNYYAGTFRPGNDDDIENELTITWKYKANKDSEYIVGGTLTPTIDTEKNTYSGDIVLGDAFDYKQQYDFQFFYKDKVLGTSDDLFEPGTVTRGIPVYWWSEDSFHVEGDLYIKDKVVSPDGLITVYSTEEQVVGTWINGKPVYRTTYVGSLLNVTSTWTNIVQKDDVDEVINLLGSISNTSTDGRSLFINTWEDKSYNCTFSYCPADGNMIQARVTGWNNAAWKFVFKLHFEYTKTTDIATVASITLEEEEGV